jgi:hypothetical protein
MITLHIHYIDSKRIAPKLLFNFDISGETNTLDFCVSEFTSPLVDENFSILISVSGQTGWFNGLELTYTPYVKKLTENRHFLSAWKDKISLSDEITSHLPSNQFTTATNSLTYSVPANKKETKAFIYSKWIDYHLSFTQNNEKNFLVYRIPFKNWQNNEKRFKLVAKICSAEVDAFGCYNIRLTKRKDFIDNVNYYQESIWSIDKIKPTDKPFKVLIEIHSNINSDFAFDLTFTSLVFGDPCADDLIKGTPVCGANGKCVSSTPNDEEFKCECDPNFGGKLCDVKNSCKEIIKPVSLSVVYLNKLQLKIFINFHILIINYILNLKN